MVINKSRRISLIIVLLISIILSNTIHLAHAETDRTTYYVTNTNSEGTGSLRKAILDANDHSGKDYIYFNIPSSDVGYSVPLGVWFIRLSIVLPILEDPLGVVIDGATQPGSHSDLPGIIIEATSALPAGSTLLIIVSNGNTVKDVGFFSSRGNSIDIDGQNNLIENNQIFTSEGHGINLISDANYNEIVGNKICGHKLDGIHLDHAHVNTIDENIIGLQPAYIPTIPNTLGNGIRLIESRNNTIENNTISDNGTNGISISLSTGNHIESNTIGLSEDRYVAHGNGQFGIYLSGGINTEIYSNWISANAKDGIRLENDNTLNNHIESNYIGTSYGGPKPNQQHGIGIYNGAHDNFVGRALDADYYNVIYGNLWSGVVVVNSPFGRNYIGSNFILNNQYYGVHINNSPENYIVFNTIIANGISGSSAGVRIENSTPTPHLPNISDRNLIQSNSITWNFGKGIQLVGDANAEIEAPLIASASCSQVSGTTSCPGCSVQIFSDDDDEGRVLEGLVLANSSGNFSWAGHHTGPSVTATVFDSLGNTSQFSIPFINPCYYAYLPVIIK